MNDEIMVSVPMLVYNHEKTVARAIESILKQKTQYRYEIIVADDASTDNSPNIIREYARKYPDIIVPVLREKNLGMQDNNIETLKLCRGKYISGCEGDDYWLTEDKMEKQISFLENNPDYSTCVTKCKFIVDGKEEPYPFADTDSLSILDMLNGGDVKRYATCTIAGRNYPNEPELLDYYRTGGIGDIIAECIGITHGKIHFMDDVTGTYERVTQLNGKSFSSSKMSEQVNLIRQAIEKCKEITGYKYNKYWNRYMATFNRAVYYEVKTENNKKNTKLFWHKELTLKERIYLRRQLIIDYINYKRNR